MPAEFDIVEVLGLTHPKDADQLVLAAKETALPGIGFDPYGEVEHLAVNIAACLDQLGDMAPVRWRQIGG